MHNIRSILWLLVYSPQFYKACLFCHLSVYHSFATYDVLGHALDFMENTVTDENVLKLADKIKTSTKNQD
jgi:hypothetical protein